MLLLRGLKPSVVWLVTGHRFDDTKGLRRRKISHHSAMASIVHIGQIDKAVKSQPRKKSAHLETEPHKVMRRSML